MNKNRNYQLAKMNYYAITNINNIATSFNHKHVNQKINVFLLMRNKENKIIAKILITALQIIYNIFALKNNKKDHVNQQINVITFIHLNYFQRV